MWRNVRANQTELKRRCGSVQFDRPSTARSSPSKPSRAHDLLSRARAEGLLGLLCLIPGLLATQTSVKHLTSVFPVPLSNVKSEIHRVFKEGVGCAGGHRTRSVLSEL